MVMIVTMRRLAPDSHAPPTVTEDGMKLLALVESPDHVCCRYRIRAFEPALRRAGWSLRVKGLERGAFVRSFQLHRASQYDAVILQRKLLPGWQLHILRRAARHLVFDFDDAVGVSRFVRSSRAALRLAASTIRSDGTHGRHRHRRQRFPGGLRTASRSQGRASPCDSDLRGARELSDGAARPTPRARSTSSGSGRRARSRAWNNHDRSGNGWPRRSLA